MALVIAAVAIIATVAVVFTIAFVADPIGALGGLVRIGLNTAGLVFLLAGILTGNGGSFFTGLLLIAAGIVIGRALRRA